MSFPWSSFLNQRDVRETNITRIGESEKSITNDSVPPTDEKLVVIPHSLGVAPTYAFVTLHTTVGSGGTQYLIGTVTAMSSTEIRVKVNSNWPITVNFAIHLLLFI